MEPGVVTRFAPSPTGALHPGNARTALFSYLLARASGGRFIMRIEDTDRERDGEAFVAPLLDDLAWLGIAHDAGPGREDGRGPYRQSERGEIYAAYFDRLEAEGKAYPCFCTPAELEPALRFAVPMGAVVRFEDRVRGPQSVEAASIGDFVVRRADGSPVFFFCNAVDDALMGVTDVLRGDDHLSNAPRQLLLLEALGLRAPAYGHLPLLLDAGGAPQSKRRGSVTVAELRRRGYLPAALANYLLRLGHHGAPDAWVEPGEMPAHFHADKLGRAPAHFDPVQLDHWQREAVRRLDTDGVVRWLAAEFPPDCPPSRRAALAGLLKGNVVLPADAREWLAVLGGPLPELESGAADAIREAGPEFFAAALACYQEAGADFAAFAERLKSRTGRKGRKLFMPLRFALTGRHDGPELAALVAAMPESLVRDRLAGASRLGSH